MRLYFYDGQRKVGIDTKAETWTNDYEPTKHKIISVTAGDLDKILRKIDFCAWNYDKELENR